MIQLEGLAGITPSVFFLLRYLLPFCSLLLFRSDCSGSLLLTILFLILYGVEKWGGLFFDFLPDRIRGTAIFWFIWY